MQRNCLITVALSLQTRRMRSLSLRSARACVVCSPRSFRRFPMPRAASNSSGQVRASARFVCCALAESAVFRRDGIFARLSASDRTAAATRTVAKRYCCSREQAISELPTAVEHCSELEQFAIGAIASADFWRLLWPWHAALFPRRSLPCRVDCVWARAPRARCRVLCALAI